MTEKHLTTHVRITRGQMMGETNTTGNVVSAAWTVKKRLRDAGIPAIGSLGLLAVEWGTLTIQFDASESCQYDDAWIYSWTGRPVPDGMDLNAIAHEGRALVIDKSLAALIAEADEL